MAISAAVPGETTSKGLHVGLWVVQGLVGATFLMAGFMKLTTPMDQLLASMPWVSGAMGHFVRFIALAEIAGALGLILPSATRIRPKLTVLAGLGLATVMTLAALTHLVRGEAGMLPINLTLGGLAGFVAWGRAKKAP